MNGGSDRISEAGFLVGVVGALCRPRSGGMGMKLIYEIELQIPTLWNGMGPNDDV